MALRDAPTTDQDEDIMIGFRLLPPYFLETIHFRSELRLVMTTCREG